MMAANFQCLDDGDDDGDGGGDTVGAVAAGTVVVAVTCFASVE